MTIHSQAENKRQVNIHAEMAIRALPLAISLTTGRTFQCSIELRRRNGSSDGAPNPSHLRLSDSRASTDSDPRSGMSVCACSSRLNLRIDGPFSWIDDLYRYPLPTITVSGDPSSGTSSSAAWLFSYPRNLCFGRSPSYGKGFSNRLWQAPSIFVHFSSITIHQKT